MTTPTDLKIYSDSEHTIFFELCNCLGLFLGQIFLGEGSGVGFGILAHDACVQIGMLVKKMPLMAQRRTSATTMLGTFGICNSA